MHRIGVIFALCLLLAACGDGGSGGNSDANTNSGSAGSGSPPGQFVTVNVISGQTATGLDVTVPPPAASPAPNALDLGAGGNTAFGTGAPIRAGQTAPVLLFGPGLAGNMTVRISGPSDIAISDIVAIRATDGTPGLQFTAAVASGAALGGRTVFLTNPQNDITAFSGGLEVVP